MTSSRPEGAATPQCPSRCPVSPRERPIRSPLLPQAGREIHPGEGKEESHSQVPAGLSRGHTRRLCSLGTVSVQDSADTQVGSGSPRGLAGVSDLHLRRAAVLMEPRATLESRRHWYTFPPHTPCLQGE